MNGIAMGRALDRPDERPPVDALAAVATHDRLGAAQVAAVFGNVAIGVTGASAAAMVLGFALVQLGAVAMPEAAAWAGLVTGCAGIHILLAILYRRSDHTQARWRLWGAWFTAACLAEGMAWGWGSVFLSGSERLDLRLLVFVVCFGIAAGAIPAFGAFLPAFLVMFLSVTIPELVRSLLTITASAQQSFFVMMAAVFIAAMGGLGLRFNGNFRDIILLKIRGDDLATELRWQKDVAERANLAKSTFLAAASHDLRQPVHALSLFVGALRNVAIPPDGLRLLDQIEASTLALDSLFGSILDISRLDAGIVGSEPYAFPIDDLLKRICGDHAAEAAAKDLALVQVPCSAVVFTDPVLMERILRNLVVNAIRHTRSGRVLVGCRRRGDRLRVEVWDTGRGIPPDDHERIFQEYTQLDNPERDRVKGLGLGLAIVRRLSKLLACPVDLRSTPGRGSRFGVSLPVASGQATRGAMPDPVGNPAAERGLILVVDDEQAIQEGMARLLTGWGYAAIVAGSGAEMLERLAACRDVPVLIICDYRLRGDETGPVVIERLQSEYNEPIPAVLITGDTAPDRLVEAQASGFLLLHKPVPNGKLRAAISHLIAAAQAEAGDAAA